MKAGDLVRPTVSCAGSPGSIRCDSALIFKVYPKGSAKNAWEPGYDFTEYDLICSCGEFPAASCDLEKIHESR